MKLKPMDNMVIINNRAEYDLLMSIYEFGGWKWYDGEKPTEWSLIERSNVKFPFLVDINNYFTYEEQWNKEHVSLEDFFIFQDLTLNKSFAVPGIIVESKQVGDEYTGKIVSIGNDSIQINNESCLEWSCKITKNGDIATDYGKWDYKSYLKVIGYKSLKEDKNMNLTPKDIKVGQKYKVKPECKDECQNCGNKDFLYLIVDRYSGGQVIDSYSVYNKNGRRLEACADCYEVTHLLPYNVTKFSELTTGNIVIDNNGDEHSVLFANGLVAVIEDDGAMIYSEREFEDRGFWFGETEKTTELTMDEIAEKFSVPVEQLKIKKE